MNSSTEVRVPRETVNDDFVTITEWHRAAGDKVRSKDVLVSIETSKAVLEVEAESDGYLQILHPKGAEVAVGELIGHIHAQQAQAVSGTQASSNGDRAARTPHAAQRADADAEAVAVGAPAISRKAQRLIDEYGLDASVFDGRGMVREADVIRYLEERREAGDPARQTPDFRRVEPAPEAEAAAHEQGEGAAEADAAGRAHRAAPPASTPTPTEPYTGRRRSGERKGLLGDARSAAGDRGKSVVFVALNYFWRNWMLGNLVKVAPRGVDLFLHRLRGVKMGEDCFIDPSAIVETAFPENITLGNDVRITAGCVIMTHIKAPHYLRDTGIMPAVLKPVVIEDHAFIGVNSVVMPGVTIGRAAVVASGSVVVSNVPAYTMVAGNPAKVIKRFPKPGEDAGDAPGAQA